MRVIGIIGHKKSGKTTLTLKLSVELIDRRDACPTGRHKACTY